MKPTYFFFLISMKPTYFYICYSRIVGIFSYLKCLVFFFPNYIQQLCLLCGSSKTQNDWQIGDKRCFFQTSGHILEYLSLLFLILNLLNLVCLTFPFFNSSQELGKSFHSSLSLTSRYANECLRVSFFPFTHNSNAILKTTDLCILQLQEAVKIDCSFSVIIFTPEYFFYKIQSELLQCMVNLLEEFPEIVLGGDGE